MNKRNLLLTTSIFLNIILVSLFAYKLYNNWFEMGVPKAPFRESIFNAAPIEYDKFYFIGDSHTEAFELNELLHNENVRNRGIWGDVSGNVLKRLDNVLKQHPKKVFLMIGVNDICSGVSVNNILSNIENIVKKIQETLPTTEIYIESVLPTNQRILHSKDNATYRIKTLNNGYKEICKKNKLVYIDLFPNFLKDDSLKQEYSFDGLHLNGEGYKLLAKLLEPFVNK